MSSHFCYLSRSARILAELLKNQGFSALSLKYSYVGFIFIIVLRAFQKTRFSIVTPELGQTPYHNHGFVIALMDAIL